MRLLIVAIAVLLAAVLVATVAWLRARDRRRVHVMYGPHLDRAAEFWGMERHNGETDRDLRDRVVRRITRA